MRSTLAKVQQYTALRRTKLFLAGNSLNVTRNFARRSMQQCFWPRVEITARFFHLLRCRVREDRPSAAREAACLEETLIFRGTSERNEEKINRRGTQVSSNGIGSRKTLRRSDAGKRPRGLSAKCPMADGKRGC